MKRKFANNLISHGNLKTQTIVITSVISLRAVSQPRENSVPGTLLLIVEGITTIGIQNSGWLLRFSVSCNPAW